MLLRSKGEKMLLSNGSLTINENNICPYMNIDTFMSLYNGKFDKYGTSKIIRFIFREAIEISGKLFWVIVKFNDGSINMAELKIADENLRNTYENWSTENASIKKKILDEWLEEILGKPSKINTTGIIYEYRWGNVISYSDMKGGEVAIVIKYNLPSIE